MENPTQAGDVSTQVYERYLALNRLAAGRLGGVMSGRLVFYGQVDERGAATALAANILGAASLGTDSDPEVLKTAIRSGVCDFMVNSLDEALRILKNEIRKKQPVSVCLQQDPDDAAEEMAARGVQPDLLAPASQQTGRSAVAIGLLFERGAVALPPPHAGSEPGREGVHWGVEEFPALWLPRVDALAAEAVGDELRRRWLRLAPGYLGRRAHSLRYVEMSEEEMDGFLRAIRRGLDAGDLQAAVSVRCRGREERLTPKA